MILSPQAPSWSGCFFCTIAFITCFLQENHVSADGDVLTQILSVGKIGSKQSWISKQSIRSNLDKRNRVDPELRYHYLIYINDERQFDKDRRHIDANFRRTTHKTVMYVMSPENSSESTANEYVRDTFELPQITKMNFNLFRVPRHELGTRKRHQRSDAESQECIPTTFNVLISTSSFPDIPSLQAQINQLCFNPDSNSSLCQARGSSSKKKLLVDTSDCYMREVAHRLAEHPEVTWIEVQSKMKLRNKYATRIVQSTNGTSRTLWANGLQGDGEVRHCALPESITYRRYWRRIHRQNVYRLLMVQST
jgi:hypothetical protein